jgi:uncharacterized membrane protein YuzA (DUF378 family)
MKTLDCVVMIVLVIGGLNWGLVGLAGFNFLDMIFGSMPALMRIVYVIVGIAAVYKIFQWKAMQKRCRSSK